MDVSVTKLAEESVESAVERCVQELSKLASRDAGLNPSITWTCWRADDVVGSWELMSVLPNKTLRIELTACGSHHRQSSLYGNVLIP